MFAQSCRPFYCLQEPAVSLQILHKWLLAAKEITVCLLPFVSADVFWSYTFRLVQLHHKQLHHWTATTPASTAGDTTQEKAWTHGAMQASFQWTVSSAKTQMNERHLR